MEEESGNGSANYGATTATKKRSGHNEKSNNFAKDAIVTTDYSTGFY
jgi:hypothetical protein